MPKWVFPPYQPGYIAQDPIQRGFFTVGSIRGLEQALVREAVQNALDARLDDSTVEVRVNWITAKPDDYREYIESLTPHLVATEDGAISVPDLSKDMKFLVVEDYNTTGLEGDTDVPYFDAPQSGQNFYYFWRNVGRSGKVESTRGRWGLGKTVFPAISEISTFFGLTCRANDGKRYLMGQSVLKHHVVNGVNYTPYGYFGIFASKGSDRYFALPIDDDREIDKFCATFGVTRNKEAGLSIVIPAPNNDATPTNIAVGAIQQYFYPILVGTLRLVISNVRLDATNLELGVRQLPQEKIKEDIRFDKETFLRTLNFVKWTIDLPEDEYYVLNPPNVTMAPRWKAYLTDEQIAQARERFEATNRIAFLVGLKVKLQGKRQVHLGSFKVFLERDDKLSRAESHYLRSGILLVDVKGHSLRGIRGLVVVDDPVVSRMLGDAENPAHTEWQKDTPAFKKYEHGPSTLDFVKGSLAYLAARLTEVQKAVERDLLKDIFFVQQPSTISPRQLPGGVDVSQPDQGRSKFVMPELQSPIQAVTSRKIANGIEISANPEANAAISAVEVHFAYEVRRGNAFQRYSPLDFDLSEPNMKIETVGAEIETRQENILRLRIVRVDFRVRVTGFDGLRDIVIRIITENIEGNDE